MAEYVIARNGQLHLINREPYPITFKIHSLTGNVLFEKELESGQKLTKEFHSEIEIIVTICSEECVLTKKIQFFN